MDEGGTIGFALTDDGDIEAVFKNKQLNKTPHAMDGVIPQAVASGGVKLDCYGEKLVSIYEDYGFVPVARVEFNDRHANPGWDKSKGTPYVYFMMHNGDSAETVVSNIGKYGQKLGNLHAKDPCMFQALTRPTLLMSVSADRISASVEGRISL